MQKSENTKTSPFAVLSGIDVKGKTEKIGNLTYLSWPWAWGLLKDAFPKSYYTIYENPQGFPYHTDGRFAWVKTGLTLVSEDGELEHIEYLPIMDNRHKSIPLDRITSFEVNTAIQRSLTKAAARHGLGLNVYAGEDLLMFREDDGETAQNQAPKARADKDSQPIGKPMKGPLKIAVTQEMYEKGKLVNVIADLASYNDDCLPEWESGKEAIKYRKNADGVVTKVLDIPSDIMELIERDAIAARQQARLQSMQDNAAQAMATR